jgi:hypothetical protein
VQAAIAKKALWAEWLRRDFYVAMALTFIVIVLYGFSQTFGANLAHPPYTRPWILYVHAVVFPLWIVVFFVQTVLARGGYLRIHRTIGRLGIGLGALLPIVAIATAVTMDRLHAAHGEQPGFFPAFFVVHVNDELAFITLIALAATYWNRPAVHSRLMFVAACILMDSPFSRFPVFQARPFAITLAVSYACADLLILCGVARDRLLGMRPHAVYRAALPALITGQAVTTQLFATAPSWWLGIVHRLVGA